MSKVNGKIVAIGSSMGVIIPKSIRTELGLEHGTPVSMEVDDGVMMLRNLDGSPIERDILAALAKVSLVVRESKDIPAELRKELLTITGGVLHQTVKNSKK